MVVYHVTQRENLEAILSEGLQPFSRKALAGLGLLCFWLELTHAMEFNDFVFGGQGVILTVEIESGRRCVKRWNGQSRPEVVSGKPAPPERIKVLS